MILFKLLIPLLLSVLFWVTFPTTDAETIKQTMEGSVDLEFNYPDSVVIGRIFPISILVENNGWEEKQDITFVINNPDGSINPVSTNEIVIEKLSTGGSYGQTIDFKISSDATVGIHFLNVLYSQVLVKNNEEPLDPTISNIAIPIMLKDQPTVTIHTITPEAIFPNAEFPFEVEILSEDIDLKDITIQITAPDSIEFLGETTHTFSSIQQNVPISITSQIKTPQENIVTEHKIPFEVTVSFTDDIGEEKTDSKTVPLILRPRTFMEITTDGGIWIGDFFIAPYVSVGTIIGIPAGTLFSIAIKRSLDKKKKLRKPR